MTSLVTMALPQWFCALVVCSHFNGYLLPNVKIECLQSNSIDCGLTWTWNQPPQNGGIDEKSTAPNGRGDWNLSP